MQDLMQPLIHKAALRDIKVHIARTGLSIGDEVMLLPAADGGIDAYIQQVRRFLGIFPRQVTTQIGTLGPNACALLGEAVQRGESLRVRIVGLTPEYLTQPGQGPEIHISVWGDPRRLTSWLLPETPISPPPMNAEPIHVANPAGVLPSKA